MTLPLSIPPSLVTPSKPLRLCLSAPLREFPLPHSPHHPSSRPPSKPPRLCLSAPLREFQRTLP